MPDKGGEGNRGLGSYIQIRDHWNKSKDKTEEHFNDFSPLAHSPAFFSHCLSSTGFKSYAVFKLL